MSHEPRLSPMVTNIVLLVRLLFCFQEARILFDCFVLIWLPELCWVSFKFNSVCASSLILRQLNFEKTSR